MISTDFTRSRATAWAARLAVDGARGERGRGLCLARGCVAIRDAGRNRVRRGTVAPARREPSASTATTPSCGTDPVVLNAYFETGFDIPFKLSEEFTKQFPNVTWDIKQDQFANLMTATPAAARRATTRPT